MPQILVFMHFESCSSMNAFTYICTYILYETAGNFQVCANMCLYISRRGVSKRK